jgi:SAM-dependent methyltransferase
MSATRAAADLDSAAFTRWCEDQVFTPAIRRGTEILERACDLHLLDLHRELGIAAMLATPRTSRDVADELEFEASAHLALEALLTRLAERTGVVSMEPGPPTRFQSLAGVPDGTAELTALRSAMAELGPGFMVALEFLDFGRTHFVTALRDDPGMMDRVLSGADAEHYPLWVRATNADPMQDLHGQMGAEAVAELFPGGTILEIGGGTGNGIRHLFGRLQARGSLDWVESYVFTDVSPRFILGTRRAIREAFPSVACDWKYLDINRPFSSQGIEPNSVDLVYGVNSAHVAMDMVGMLRDCAAALRPGGRVVFAERVRRRPGEMAARELTLNLSRYHRTAAQRNPQHRVAHGYLSPHCWLAVLEQAGFRDAAIHPDLALVERAFPEHYAAVVTAVRGCGQ